MCRYTNGNLNVRFESGLNAACDICIKESRDVLGKVKTTAVIIEMNSGAVTQENIELLIKALAGNQWQINDTLQHK